MKRFPMPSAERLRALFDYDAETGVVTAKTDRPSRRGAYKAGARIGRFDAFGYLMVNVDGKQYGLHRVIWKLVTGDEPPLYVDHVNRDRADNRWVNLRAATARGNNANSGVSRRNLSGAKGVRLTPTTGRWTASVTRGGKTKHLGTFATKREAEDAYLAGAREAFGEFANPADGPQRVVFDVVDVVDEAFLQAMAAATRRMWKFRLDPAVPPHVQAVLDDIGLDISTELVRVAPDAFRSMRTRRGET